MGHAVGKRSLLISPFGPITSNQIHSTTPGCGLHSHYNRDAGTPQIGSDSDLLPMRQAERGEQ